MSISLPKNLNKKELNKLKQNIRYAMKDITHEKKLEWNFKEGELVITKQNTVCYYNDENSYSRLIELEKDSILIIANQNMFNKNLNNNFEYIFFLYDGKIVYMSPINLVKI